ncbi:hypothetical protein SG34_028810 [Thalassomonas viridans]|uniref:Uncharacterized protein n=1 Tax=Thalassomonas viridans TaxID=137584 RepID=A0AAE9Z372_9GAMM|nr:hypothetical protein [Thalassomonas viridans]WDE05244.1 hypothetical protein SG34_028810 [Thalassomonas viridans]
MVRLFQLTLIFAGVIYAIVSQNPFHVSIIINVSLLIIMLISRDNINVVHLCTALLFVYVVEMLVFQNLIVTKSDTMSSMTVNAIIFSFNFITDLVLFFLLIFRAPITRAILESKGKDSSHIYKYNAELALISLMTLFMVVDLMALVENFLRHLDKFGITGPVAEFFADWTLVYNQYENMKFTLLGLTILLVWMMASNIGQQPYKEPDSA